MTLGTIDAWLRAHTPVTAASLRPPVSVAGLAAAKRHLPAPLPKELRELYRWHDGTVGPAGCQAPFDIQPSLYFLSLERLIEAWRYLDDFHRSVHANARNWQSHWLPIAADDCGAHMIIETGGEHPGRLFWLSDEDGPHYDQSWPSLWHWAEELTVSLTTGGLFAKQYRPAINNGALTWVWTRPPRPQLPVGYESPV